MKKFTLLLAFLCFVFAANSRLGAQTDPDLLQDLIDNQFNADLPVIQELGLRVDLTAGTPDVIQVEMNETYQDVLGLLDDEDDPIYSTKVWGYTFPGLPTTYPGATIVAMEDMRVNIRWLNNLPGHFLPVDASLHMAHPANLQYISEIRDWYDNDNVPTVTHLHGGHTETASDGIPEAWFTQDFMEKGAYFQKKNYRYDNNQESATLWYHDHALGITRLNVYAGLAGFYLLRDQNELNLINNNTLPGGDYEIEIVIQDRMFDDEGQLFWPAYPDEGPYNEFIYDEGAILPDSSFEGGGPSALAEFFGDVILVNGKAWPSLQVEPRKYRFRLLNGSDSRFYILQLDNGTGAGSDNIMVIGTDDGLLESPVVLSQLAIAPGERYDVVVDFSGYDPALEPNITLTNWGPDSPAAGWEIDYPDENDPDDPDDDYPGDIADENTTGKIMQFQVTLDKSAVPDASVAEGTLLNTITWPVAENSDNPRQLALFEGNDEYGRLQPMLGTLEDGSLTWSDSITENPMMNSTELWEVYNATGDAHPIHLHLVKFRILDREGFTYSTVEKDQVQHNGAVGTGFMLEDVELDGGEYDPLDHEKGWKDTFIVPPGQVGRIVAFFDRPGRYVWHCHILSHEDHEMMRVLQVGAIPMNNKGKKKGAAVEDQLEPDQFEFRLYPNPASDMTTVDFVLAESADVTISIYGMDGRMINSEELGYLNEGLQSIAVPVGHLDNGMYILDLKAGNKQFRESFIVNK